MQKRGWPPTLSKLPPSRIFPSLCKTILKTKELPLTLALKAVSSVPLALRRAMPLRGVPKTVLKKPPIRIFPSGCTTTVDKYYSVVRVRIETIKRGLALCRGRDTKPDGNADHRQCDLNEVRGRNYLHFQSNCSVIFPFLQIKTDGIWELVACNL